MHTRLTPGCRSQAEVHVVLDRGHFHAGAVDFRGLEFDVGIEHGVGEHAAFGQERTVLVQALQRLVQACLLYTSPSPRD